MGGRTFARRLANSASCLDRPLSSSGQQQCSARLGQLCGLPDQAERNRGAAPENRHLVLLVHGIGRGPGSFGGLPGILRKAGFAAHAISYPSTRGSIEGHAAQLERLLLRVQNVDEVSFVTHSMGGIIVRRLLARDGAWKSRAVPARLVMIAPPNQGSLVAQTLQPAWPYKLVYGTAGQQLTPEKVLKLPVPDIPFGIIAGGLGDGQGYNPVLPGDDDGTVAVAETRLRGAVDFMVLPGLHGFVARSQEIEPPVLNFLRSGHFTPARSRQDG